MFRRWVVVGVASLLCACDALPSESFEPLGFEALGTSWHAEQHPVTDSILFNVVTYNFSREPVHFESRTFGYDFLVHDTTGRLVWQRVLAAIGPNDPFTVAPGQQDAWEETWLLQGLDGVRVPGGTYTVTALVGPDLDAPLVRTDPVSFEVAPATPNQP